MPYKSRAQAAFMHIHHPEIAKRWDEHTPEGKKLPYHVKHKKTETKRAAEVQGHRTAWLNDLFNRTKAKPAETPPTLGAATAGTTPVSRAATSFGMERHGTDNVGINTSLGGARQSYKVGAAKRAGFDLGANALKRVGSTLGSVADSAGQLGAKAAPALGRLFSNPAGALSDAATGVANRVATIPTAVSKAKAPAQTNPEPSGTDWMGMAKRYGPLVAGGAGVAALTPLIWNMLQNRQQRRRDENDDAE